MPTGSYLHPEQQQSDAGLTTDQTVMNPKAGSYNPQSIIGTAVPRIDGPLKTSGTAKYTADYNLPNMAYAVPVCARISKGQITRLDASKAQSMRGVLRVYYHGNAPKLYRPNPADRDAHVDEKRPAFEDNTIRYAGQYVAVVVAETMDQARAAARAVVVEYAVEKPDNNRDLSDGLADHSKLKEESKRGDVDAAFASAPVKIDYTYVTPVETHNPIEMHASVADWDGSRFILYETTQSLKNQQAAMAAILGVPPEQVQIVMKFLGSGFGGKLFPWTHAPLAAAAARDLKRPVKLVVDRHMMFTNVGHRPRTQQHLRLAATREGKLVSLEQDYTSEVSVLDDVGENCGEATPFLYSTPNLRVRSHSTPRNVGTPTAMRGPGAVPGLYALESAVDELCVALKMDPVQFRLLNEPAMDESENKPFSSRHLKECLTTGAEKFGWAQRTPEVGSMKRDGLTIGWGVASAAWIAIRLGCESRVTFLDNGRVRISCATQDIGTGTYTIFAQIVHAKTGIPLDRIEVTLGDSSLPSGPISGGSFVTASVIPSISKACEAAVKQILAVATSENAPYQGTKPDELSFTGGRIHRKSEPESTGQTFDAILRTANLRESFGDGKSLAIFEDPDARKYSLHSYGAQFVEVEWDPGIARLRVSRVVTVIDGGRIINLKPATNQVEGAVVMGVGMALFEETVYDQRYGSPVNNNLADYIVATSRDCPKIDVTFLNYPDLVLNEYGARGIGEIGLAGVAPAITAAVYHATGIRVRELPVTIEKLLGPASTSKLA